MIVRRLGLAGLMVLIGLSQTRAQDSAAGAKVFQQVCSICHSAVVGQTVVGPSDHGRL
jgi:cytochrome c2